MLNVRFVSKPGFGEEALLRAVRDSSNLSLELGLPNEYSEVSAVIARYLLSGGKRLRPKIVYFVANLLGLQGPEMATCARAAEFTHAASIAHDDVIDNAPIRRSAPTLQCAEGVHQAVLAGDLLVSRAMEELISSGLLGHARTLSTTLRALSLGEWIETQSRFDIDRAVADLHQVHVLKTGSLLKWSAQAAPSLLGMSSDQIEKFGLFGERLGYAYQCVDDLVDFQENSGKPYAQDLREGVINLVSAQILKDFPESESRVRAYFLNHRGESPRNVFEAEWIRSSQVKVQLIAEAKIRQAVSDLVTLCRELVLSGVLKHDPGLSEDFAESLIDVGFGVRGKLYSAK